MFVKSLKSEYTRMSYESSFEDFVNFMKLDNASILKIKPKKLQNKIIDYISDLESKKRAPQTIRSRLAAVKHFLSMNDVTLNWDKIYRFVPEARKTVKDRIYTKQEIQKILEKADERRRLIVLILLSTGIRIGALPGLKLRNLSKMNNGCYKFTIYEGSNDEYTTFCTHECTKAIDSYLEFRKQYGETLTPNAPLIREQFEKNAGTEAKHLSISNYRSLLTSLLYDSGLRTNEHSRHKRKEIMMAHGFRKYFNTMLIQAGAKPVVKEMMLGHKVGLEGSYYRPTDEELLAEYQKAIDLLTISEEKKLQQQVQKLKVETEQIEAMKIKYLQLESKLDDAVIDRRAMMKFLSALEPEQRQKFKDILDQELKAESQTLLLTQ